MRDRPLIGHATQSGASAPGPETAFFAGPEAYAHAIVAAGGAPLLIPSVQDEDVLERLYTLLDGLILSGGPDIEPARYGQQPDPLAGTPDPAMDHAEFYMARRALQNGMPILGICRGLQTLNVAGGGTLHQHIGPGSTFDHPAAPWRDLAHPVRITEGSLLRQVLRCEEIAVNSLHHQALRDLAPAYRVSAVAPDGLVEALEHHDRPFVLAVQWHPEELLDIDPRWLRLFTAFVEAAASYRAARTLERSRR